MADQDGEHNHPTTYTAADLGLDDDELSPVYLDPQLIMFDRVHSQRPLDPDKVAALMKLSEADRQSKRVIVGVRKSGSMVGIDGQHRVYAAVLCRDPSIPAMVFPSDGWKDERDVYTAFSRWEIAARDKQMRLDAPESEESADAGGS